jgi:pyruvate dehydrogenase E1 component alpha subunit
MTQTDVELRRGSAPDGIRVRLYGEMVRMRVFEQRVQTLFLQNELNGPAHLSTGQEAIAAAFGLALAPGDLSLSTYRSHAQILARGVPMGPVFAELMGRDGLLGGKGGSMHLTSTEHGHLGAYAIVGAHLPIAVGTAWASQVRGVPAVTTCFFGDGATNIGAFHEAVNLAAVWRAPVVFVCENNLYMEYTRTEAVTAVTHPAADRAAAYGLEGRLVDGNDPDAMLSAAFGAVADARRGDGPVVLEAMTYRHSGHAQADPAKYRPEGELESYLAADPIAVYRARLLEDGVASDLLDDLDAAAAAEADAGVRWAADRPLPAGSALETNVWADGGSAWRS